MLPAFVSPLANHLWQSTLFAAAAALLTLALKKNHARTRYWIWFTASLKFLIPFSLLTSVGSRFSWPSIGAIAVPAVASVSTIVIEQVALPFTSSRVAEVAAVPAPSGVLSSALLWLALLMWFTGCAAGLFRWCRNWRRVLYVVRQAAVLTEGREFETLRHLERTIGARKPVALVSSTSAIEPCVFGVFRAVLIWPAELSGRLADEELKAIILHELSHLRRRDNLASALHMVIESMFWFHPLVWWLGKRLLDERERACDDDVLRWGGASTVYAEGIIKVCEFCLESPLVCASGVTGSNLKTRIEEIMRNRVALKLSFGRALLLAAAGITALFGPIVFGVVQATSVTPPLPAVSAGTTGIVMPEERPALVQTAQAPPTTARTSPQSPAARTAFDVVSVKLVNPSSGGGRGGGPGGSPFAAFGGGCDGSFPQVAPNRFAVTTTIYALMTWAYGFNDRGGCSFVSFGELISGGPDWIRSDRFEIQGIMPEGSPAYTQTEFLRGHAPKLEMMLQSLLADRFKLAVHHEMKEAPVYTLVLAKGGPKLTPAKADGGRGLGFRRGPDQNGQITAKLVGRKTSMSELALLLVLDTRRPVLDRTGLTGEFDFDVDYAPSDPGVGETAGPSIFTALQEQLGLKLESTKAPVDVLVIDHAEKPSDN